MDLVGQLLFGPGTVIVAREAEDLEVCKVKCLFTGPDESEVVNFR